MSSRQFEPNPRKRKCILPKQISSNDDDIQIITLSDDSDDSRKSNSSTSSIVTRSAKRARSKPKALNKQFRSMSLNFPTPTLPSYSERLSPLPNFSWGDAKEIWDLMLQKDELYQRNPLLLHRHPSLQARMRSILLDWLNEVSEVYRLHRETYYLSVDFIDRYLSINEDIPKQQLQLLGITCLFIASKMEEIYPPKLSEFAYVTDGACSEGEITIKELVVLKALNWDLYPMTINNWLTVYMQLYATLEKENSMRQQIDAFMFPEYSAQFFSQIARLIDLCMLDIGILAYPNSIIAASALYHFTNEDTVYQCAGKALCTKCRNS